MLGPGLHSWGLSSGVKFKLCSHPDTPGTKLVAKAEICWSREIKGRPTPEVKEDFPFCTFTGRLLEVKKGGGPHPIISLDMHPPGSRMGSILEKSCTHILGRVHGPELYMEQQTSSKSGKEYVKPVYCHTAYF